MVGAWIITSWRKLRGLRLVSLELVRIQRAVSHLRRFLSVLLIVLGLIISDMVFVSARTLEYSRHVDVDAPSAFDVLTGFAFIVFSFFLFLFSVLWFWDLYLEKQWCRQTGPMPLRNDSSSSLAKVFSRRKHSAAHQFPATSLPYFLAPL